MTTPVNSASNKSNGTNGTSGSSSGTTAKTGYDSLNTDTFMKILVSELSNQDPTKPMDSSEIVTQVSQIRAIEANDQLTTTLKSVLSGQNMASASSLLGKAILGLDDSGNRVDGVVSGVALSGGEAKLYVGNSTVSLNNVQAIAAEATAAE